MRVVTLGVIVAAAVLVTGFEASRPEPALRVIAARAAPGDTQALYGRWDPPINDGQGPVDSYRVQWATAPAVAGFPLTRTLPATRRVDTVQVPLPPLPGSVLVTFTVRGVRRDTLGAVASVSLTVRRPNVPLPPPSNVRIDTIAIALLGDRWMAPAESAAVDSVDVVSVAYELGVLYCAVARVGGQWFLGHPAAWTDGGVPLEPRVARAWREVWGAGPPLSIGGQVKRFYPASRCDPGYPGAAQYPEGSRSRVWVTGWS